MRGILYPLHIGMLGLGTVGGGVYRILTERADHVAERMDRPVRIVKILVRDPAKPRSVQPDAGLLTTDPREVLDDPTIAVVFEALGGEHPAVDYLRRALRNGKYVITANKEVMAKHGPELLALAAENGVDVAFEASVGGGIPLIGPFRQDLAPNRILALQAILNGTTNYILTRMGEDGSSYEDALREAQRLGYAEPDPTNDVEGLDAAYKLAILSTLAFQRAGAARGHLHRGHLAAGGQGPALRPGDGLPPQAALRGPRRRRRHPGPGPPRPAAAPAPAGPGGRRLQRRAGPRRPGGRRALLRPGRRRRAHRQRHGGRPHRPGPGPGRRAPTRSRPVRLGADRQVAPAEEARSRHYLRLIVEDQPGVLAQIAGVLGAAGISIASMIQKEANGDGSAEIVITTHPAAEGAMRRPAPSSRPWPSCAIWRATCRIES